MKKLQNNFTTPEQSKRLLELNVPTDSADCYLMKCKYGKDIYRPKILYDETYSQLDKFTNVLDYLPCWSDGRLMNIYDICNTYEMKADWSSYEEGFDYIEYIINAFDKSVKANKIDFSKLEE